MSSSVYVLFVSFLFGGRGRGGGGGVFWGRVGGHFYVDGGLVVQNLGLQHHFLMAADAGRVNRTFLP